MNETVAAQQAHPMAHTLLHAVMLHGTVPQNILPGSEWAFSIPAWSISLEWQFYLIALIVISITRSSLGAVLVLLVSGAGAFVFFHHGFGEFKSMSFIAGAAPFFAVGIGSRIIIPKLYGRIEHGAIIALVSLTFVPMASFELIALLIWVAFFAVPCSNFDKEDRVEYSAARAFRVMFTHPAVRFWGDRSYSVYLCHLAVISMVVYVLAPRQPSFAVIAALSIAGTAAVAIIAHALIEKPGIRLGRLLASRIALRSPWLPLPSP